jgi:hypothetical protein
VSAFGSVIAVTTTVDLATAQLTANRFIEVLIAPDYEPAALEFLRAKSKQLRLLKLHRPLEAGPPRRRPSARSTAACWCRIGPGPVLAQWMTPTAARSPRTRNCWPNSASRCANT